MDDLQFSQFVRALSWVIIAIMLFLSARNYEKTQKKPPMMLTIKILIGCIGLFNLAAAGVLLYGVF